MKSFFYFLNDVKKYFLIAFILTILGMSASLLIPYGNQILIDKALLNNSFHYLIVSIEIIAASAIIIVLFKSITNYLLRLAGEKIWVKINQTLHKKLRNIENIFELQDGRYISYFTNDAKLYKDAYLIIFQIIPDALMIIVLFIIVSSMSVFLGILILFLVILFGLFSKKIGEKVQKTSMDIQNTHSNIVTKLTESLLLSREIRIFNKESWDGGNLEKALNGIIRPNLKREILNSFLFLSFLGYYLITCFLMFYGGKLVLEGKLSPGYLISLITYISYLKSPVQSLIFSYTRLKEMKAGIKRIENLLNIKERENGYEILDVTKPFNIVIEDLTYAVKNQVILDKVTLTIPYGSFISIIGKSGSGKSTFAKILSNLITPTSGRILIQDKEIYNIERQSFYSNICIVLQDNSFFNGSIKENILFYQDYVDDYSIDQINQVIKETDLSKTIYSLPGDLNYILEQNAAILSGGEKQRLALIRALIKNTPILILDEITSALDGQTESLVIETIKKWRIGKTTILITHRTKALDESDLIIEFEKGKIIDKTFVALEKI